MTGTGVSFITTFRHGDPRRLDNLRSMLAWALSFDDWQVVVVEQDRNPRLDGLLPAGVIHHRLIHGGPFNKSWGMNVGAARSSAGVLVIADADMIVDRPAMRRAVAACATRLDAVRPYARLIDLTADQSRAFHAGQGLPEAPAEGGFDRGHAGETLCLCGGIFVIRRGYYERLGGMDERFEGWGGEDDAMALKITRLSERVAIARDGIAWHLWHERADRYRHPGYRHNLDMVRQYRVMDRQALAALCDEQRRRHGDPARYDPARERR